MTQGTRADCKEASRLIEGLSAEYLLADKGYDTNAILSQAKKQGMKPVIPPKKNRVEQRDYDEALYKLRHLVENAFLHLKRWRGVATRYAKNSASLPCCYPHQMYRSLGEYLVTTASRISQTIR